MAQPRRSTITFAVDGPIEPAQLPAVCERVGALVRDSGAAVACCDARGLPADAVTVDMLARAQLAARRHGCQLELEHVSHELRELLALAGLEAVLPSRD
jgi:ABC-type transporter Mla MlaB component